MFISAANYNVQEATARFPFRPRNRFKIRESTPLVQGVRIVPSKIFVSNMMQEFFVFLAALLVHGLPGV
jgi:hypothetical protein